MLKDINVPNGEIFKINELEHHDREDLDLRIYGSMGRGPYDKSYYLHSFFRWNYDMDFSNGMIDKVLKTIISDFKDLEAIYIEDNVFSLNPTYWIEKGFTEERYFAANFFDYYSHIWIFDEDKRKAYFDSFTNQ